MRIIVTAAGGSGGRFLTEALQMAGHYVIGTDCDPWQLALATAEERHLVPRPPWPSDSPLTAVAWGSKADLIMPQSDAEVAELCQYSGWGPAGLFLPAAKTVRAAQDKWKSRLAWILAGIPHPNTRLAEDYQTLREAMKSLNGPVWLSRRDGAGAAGSFLIPCEEYDDASLDAAAAWINYWNAWGEFLACEYLEGVNCVADLIFWRGKLVAWAGREVLAWQMAHCSPTGVTGASRVTVLQLEEGLREIAEAAVRALPGEPHGIFGVDTIHKADGSYWVTEINAGRFNAPGPALYARAGLNLADIAARFATAAYSAACPESPLDKESAHVVAMLRGQDTPPVYLTKAEWEALGKPCES